MKFKFKSSGTKITHRKFSVDTKKSINLVRPIGIKTPVEFGTDQSELFRMHTDPIEQIKDDLKNLVQTNNGERLGRFNFGCNLKSMLFERTSLDEDFNALVQQSINDQVRRYLPIVQVDSVGINSQEKKSYDLSSLAYIIVNIKFSVPKLKIFNKHLEVNLGVGG